MKLPIPMDMLLHGKAVEWERLEFKELDMTEGRSIGIPKILHAMETNGSPPPVFDFDEDHSFFMVRLPVHPQATMPEGLGENVTVSVSPYATPTVNPTVNPTVTPAVLALMKLLYASGECGNAEVRNALSMKDRGHMHKGYLQPALQEGLIEMTIPDKPTSRLQKYSLTDKGRALLKELAR